MTTADRPRLLVADDHPEILSRVCALLAAEFLVVATVTDGPQLVAAAATTPADVLVVDVSLPLVSGLQALAAIRESGLDVPAVCMSAWAEMDLVEAAWAAGASGYVVKTELARDLVPAVRAVLDHRRFVSPSLAANVARS